MTKKIIAVAAAFVLGAGVQTASANLLTDPGFESLGVPDWVVFGSASQQEWANGAPGTGGLYGQDPDGQFGMTFQPWDGTPASPVFGGFFQDVAASDGVAYTFSIQGHTGADFPAAIDNTGNVGIRLEFLDAGMSELSRVENDIKDEWNPSFGTTDPAEWRDFQVSGIAPVGTDFVRAVVYYDDGRNAFAGEQAHRWDNGDLVPEPGSMALLGIGTLLAAAARRRRKA